MGLFTNVLKQILSEGVLQYKEKITDTVYRLTIKSENLNTINFEPGSFLRLVIGANNESLKREDAVRSYSIWNIDHAEGKVDIAVATKSKGAGAKWAEYIQPGMKVYYHVKKGKFLLDNSADSYLFIGDLSALSHLYIIHRNLSASKQIQSILYSQDSNDFFPDIDGEKPFDFFKLPENPTAQIIEKLKEVIPKMQGQKMVYLAGDSRLCVGLNQYFRRELNWTTKQIKTKPFWNPNKKGLE